MKMFADRRALADGEDDLETEVSGMGGRESEPTDVRDLLEHAEKISEMGPTIPVGVHVLTQEFHLPITGLGQIPRLLQHGLGSLACLPPARRGHDAVGTGLVATFHHSQVGPRSGCSADPAPLEGDAVLASREVQSASALPKDLLEHRRKGLDGPWSEDDIHQACPAED